MSFRPPSFARTFLLIVVAAVSVAAHADITLTIIPSAPRYLEPVYARLTQAPYATASIYGAQASMSGSDITVTYQAIPDLGATRFDVMLGRFPAGTYNVSVATPGGPVSARFTVAPAPAATQSPPYVPAVNYSDLWWNPAESGWGMSIVQGPTNELFAVWFVYDPSGNPVWYTLQPGSWSGMREYTGTIYRTSGPGFAGPFDPAQVRAVAVGTGLLDFADSGHGTFHYSIGGVTGSKSIERQPIE